MPPSVVLSDPDDIKEVFTAPPDVLHPGEGARVLEPVVGRNSVLLLDEGRHMEQRKLMLPAFHGERMQRLEGLVAEVTEQEIGRWPGDTPIALHPRMQALTLEVILRAVFGLDPGPRLDALRTGLTALLTFGDRPLSLIPIPEGSLPARVLERYGPVAEFLRHQRGTDQLISELIAERRAEHEGREDVLAMLLDARHEDGSPMSESELRDELMTLLVAGHETTASALAWACERLARLPEVRARVVAGGDEYLTATIHETLRHRPVLPNVAPRLVKRPVEVGGWSYPAGVTLVPNAYLVHHDAAIYPDPYAFRPERFVGRAPGTYTWIPFGGGRRRCLGASFALLEMRLVLRALLGARDLRPAGGGVEAPRRRNITVRPARGSLATLPPRVAA